MLLEEMQRCWCQGLGPHSVLERCGGTRDGGCSSVRGLRWDGGSFRAEC